VQGLKPLLATYDRGLAVFAEAGAASTPAAVATASAASAAHDAVSWAQAAIASTSHRRQKLLVAEASLSALLHVRFLRLEC
jgi:hypothetical protein